VVSERISFIGRALRVLAGLTLFIATSSIVGAAWPNGAQAGAGQSALVTVSPSTQTHASGTVFTYSIAISCQGTAGSQCGPNAELRIPLSTSTTPSMTSGQWTYAVTSGSVGLITGTPSVSGSDFVIGLSDAIFIAGYSGTVTLLVTPPNVVTPNHTSWSVTPSVSGDTITTVTAPSSAAANVTAAPTLSVTSATRDGGQVYQINHDITFSVGVKCSQTASGSLQLTSSSIVDTIPNNTTYVSSTPAGTYNAGARTVTWSVSAGHETDLPTGCAPTAAGPTTYLVTVRAPSTVPAVQPSTNRVTFSGVGPDATVPAGVTSSTSASTDINFVLFPPLDPGSYMQVYKYAMGPLAQAGVSTGNQYIATYAGNWLPTAEKPTFAPNSAPANFRVMVWSGMVSTYYAHIVDHLPCLDNLVGNVYSSPAVSAPVCAHPAFITSVVAVRTDGAPTDILGVGRAVTGGWRPTATLSDGSNITLSPIGTVTSNMTVVYFAVPAGATIAKLNFPPNANLRVRTLNLQFFGHAVQALSELHGGLNELKNTVTLYPQLTLGTDLTPKTGFASLFVVPPRVQLGITTAFGATGAAGGGTTAVTMTGSAAIPAVPTPHDIVITDLLPLGMTWSNPVALANVTLTSGGTGASKSVSATVSRTTDYRHSGRDLIRITISRWSFDSAGQWTISLPAALIKVTTPTDYGVYANTAEIFQFGVAPGQLHAACATPGQDTGGVSTTELLSDNREDLAGDGKLSEQFCRARASMAITTAGAAFSLTSTVRGDLDAVAKGALGVGETGPRGTGVFSLRWNNVGSDTLSNPVVYDVLPHVGDFGVSSGQSAIARDSDVAPSFVSVTNSSGVTVYYSTSSNPCRPEVYANSSNTSCVDSWSATVPSPASSVKALKFVASGQFAKGAGFSAAITVRMPATTGAEIAWNSAATNANDVTSPSTHPLPAEPPKVGLKSLAVAALTTRATKARGTVGESISDDVTITGLTSAGTLAWSFVGPVSPRQGSCSGVDFTGANVVKSGTTSVASDDTVRVGPVTTSSAGCYSWIQTLSYEVNPGDEVSVTSSPSDAAEITLVSNAPTMAVTGSNIVGVMAIGAASVLAGLFALWCARRRYE
jgi:hypothetical protein